MPLTCFVIVGKCSIVALPIHARHCASIGRGQGDGFQLLAKIVAQVTDESSGKGETRCVFAVVIGYDCIQGRERVQLYKLLLFALVMKCRNAV